MANTLQLTQTIEVPIVDDGVTETDENFTVTLSKAVNATLNGMTCTVTITDGGGNPPMKPSVQFENASYSVGEAAGSIDLKVVLSNASDKTVTVDYATADSMTQ